MKTPSPITSRLIADTSCSVKIANYPIRVLHYAELGVLLGGLLAIGIHSIEIKSPRFEHVVWEDVRSPEPSPHPSPITPANPGEGENPDRDGDFIPNEWEIQFHHDPDEPTDAGADFDNDGLTTSEEYQLSTQTNGAAGNPLGKWHAEEIVRPLELSDAWLYPVDINDKGDVLVVAYPVYRGGVYCERSFVVTPEGVWTEIAPPASFVAGNVIAHDFNDRGEVVGEMYSADYSVYGGFIWDSVLGCRPFTFKGFPAQAQKINNYGDWIGYAEDPTTGEMRSAYVVDGVNYHSSVDWWGNAWYTDINDFGEAMGTYYNPHIGQTFTFLACGLWYFDTGLNSSMPNYNPSNYSWSWNSAMNAYGEFTGGAGILEDNQWSYPGYHFDGEFHDIKLAGPILHRVSPQSINTKSTIVGCAFDGNNYGSTFIFDDGVGLFLGELFPGYGVDYAKINNYGKIVTLTDTGEIGVISPDQDQDGDGMSDDWEDFHGLDKNSAADAFADADNDGTNNLGEFLLRSDPNAPPILNADGELIDTRAGIDTDGDGIPNVWEWKNGLDYQDASDARKDFDRDGYTNLKEYRLGTDPRSTPAYRIRTVGPFPGASSVSMSPVMLGNGIASTSLVDLVGDNITESVFFSAVPSGSSNGGRRPAMWSIQRTEAEGAFSFFAATSSSTLIAQSPSGAMLAHTGASPNVFYYWSSPSALPISLSGATSSHNIKTLTNATFSPSGNYLVGTRIAQSNNAQELIVWKMPASSTQAFKPIKLLAPAGTTISQSSQLFVNDYGCITASATTTIGGQFRPIVWQVNAAGTAVTASTLPVLSGGTWARTIGISNQPDPIFAGTSTITGGLQRATIWKRSGTSFSATNLGTLSGGNSSTVTVVSPIGVLAGTSNVLAGNTLKSQPFIASRDGSSSSWILRSQGTPGANVSLRTVTDAGEVLGTIFMPSPSNKTIPTLWRHGVTYQLDTSLPPSSGYTLNGVTSLNQNGTLLATAWKDGALTTILLTPDRDTDGDGLPDSFENRYGFNAFNKQISSTDSDTDGLTDVEEYRNGTNPRNPDTDDDGMKDAWEISWGLLPLDPSDASLDPDNDRVTNLRESQIGTTPIGVYKVETRLNTGNGDASPFVAADDSGRILYNGPYEPSTRQEPPLVPSEDDFMDTIEDTTQDYYILPGTTASGSSLQQLPHYKTHIRRIYGSMSWVSAFSDAHTAWLDSSTGKINSSMWRCSYFNDWNGSSWSNVLSLIPDTANHQSPDTWISWATIESNLQNGSVSLLSPPLAASDKLEAGTNAVSSFGTRRIHRSATGRNIVLNENGQVVRELPPSIYWEKINNAGQAVAFASQSIPAANGVPAYTSYSIKFSKDGTLSSLPIPQTPGSTGYYSIQSFSDDGKVLLLQTCSSLQGYAYNEYYLYDIHTGTRTRVRQPGLGNEAITHLSTSNGRMVGNGTKPWQVTPDGTSIRLDALRIRNSPTATPVLFSTLYSKPLTTHHISSNGCITLSTYDSQYKTIILQISPNNDADNDGMTDDWERSYASEMLALGAPPEQWGANRAALQSGDLTASTTLQEDGMSMLEIFNSSNPEDYRLLLHDLFIQAKRSESHLGFSHDTYSWHQEGEEPSYSGGGNYYEGSSFGGGSIECWNRKPRSAPFIFDFVDEPFSITPMPSLEWFNNETRNATWTFHTHWDEAFDPHPRTLFPLSEMGDSSVSFTLNNGGWNSYYQFENTWDNGTAEITEQQWKGDACKSKFRLYRPRATSYPVSQTFLKVTTEHSWAQINPAGSPLAIDWGVPSTTSVESVQATIPAYGHTSQWIDTTPDAAENKHRSVSLLPVEAVPDYNRDGKIDSADRGKVSIEKPWRFWVNDNDDSGTVDGSDIPGSGNNGNDGQVNGIRDLVDWFPLFLDIKEILNVLPSADYNYVIENADNALNMVETTLTPATASDFLKAELGEPGQRNNPNGIALAHIAGYFKYVFAQGAKLSADFLSRAKDGTGGVLIMEASKATTQPLKLVIRKKSGGESVAEVSFPLRAQSVEKMYRHLNILSANGQSGGLATNLSEPENQPDAESSSKNFVFVHGYNVNPTQARGWNAAMFKRLWHSGSRAKFTGVTWYGSETQGMIPGQPSVTPNYQANVLNAFASASALKDGLEPLEGGIHIAAHSLGNMVVSSAMHDFGFAADKYFLIDAAVAKESYDETEEQRLIMSNPWWEDYDDQLRATDWHLLPWLQNDWRAKLTWVNRLKDIGNAYNFYSSGEEVLKNPEHGNIPLISGFSGELTWASQEKRKGFGLTGQILTSTYGGWETNKHVDYGTRVTHSTTGALVGFIPKTQAQLGPVDAAFKQKLMQIPFFNTGFDPVTGQTLGTAPADIANLLGPNGSDYASPQQKRNTLLAEMIPAQSTAAGSNSINSFGARNFDMNAMKTGWPATRPDPGDWFHSDIRSISYSYTFQVFDTLAETGGLRQ